MATSYSVITSSQLQRIREQTLHQTSTSTSTSAADEHRRLKQLSEERASKWPNTLQAIRARKERLRQERAAAEEAERIEEDRRQAELHAHERQVAIERANKMLFDDTDRVRTLHSSLLLSEVMAENEALAAYKAQIAALKVAQERAFHLQQLEALAAADEAEAAKLVEAKRRAVAQRDVQMAQLEALKKRIRAERAADAREGELIRKKAAAEAAELAAKEAQRRAEQARLNAETTAANASLQMFKQKEREREQEAERAIEAYCQRKAELEEQRRAEAEAREAAKEARRKAQRDAIDKGYQAWMARENGRVEAAVKEAEYKAAFDAEARRAKRAADYAAAHAMNQQQLAKKAEAAAAQKAADAAFRDAWTDRLAELRADELREAWEAKERAQKVVEFQRWQSDRKAARASAQALDLLQSTLMAQCAVEDHEAQFQAYARELQGETQTRGLATKPLEIVMHRKEKEVQPTM